MAGLAIIRLVPLQAVNPIWSQEVAEGVYCHAGKEAGT